MELDEKNIVCKCQAGDFDPFGILYDIYVKKIYSYIYFRILNKEVAEDLTSDVFLKVLKNIKKFNSKREFSPWIYTIAKNTLTDYFRARKFTKNIENVWGAKDNFDLLQKIDDKMKYEKIKEGMLQLNELQRDIIIMRVWEDMSHAEIAQALGISEQNCRVIFSRAVSKLKDVIPLSLLILLIIKI